MSKTKLSEPINISGHQVVIGSSIGIAMYPADAEDREGLLRNADLAMYQAKKQGRNCCVLAPLDDILEQEKLCK